MALDPADGEFVSAQEAREPTGGTNQFQDNLVPFMYNNGKEIKKISVPARWYWGSVVKRMITHNKAHGFTGAVLIGMSGSGKTTLTQTIIHMLHTYGEEYTVDWFNGHDMLNIDKKIKAMTVGVPHIMIFDDASYTMENAKASEIGRLANALTTVRHHVKSRVIMVMNIHYSKATKKFFRNQHFTFLTSVTTEELGNLKDLFQDKMPIIRQFGQKYRQMALQGRFYAPISLYENKFCKYEINDPFRLGLVSEITDTHFIVYPRLSCAKCVPGGEVTKVLKTKDVVNKFMEYKGTAALKTVLAFWMTINNVNGEQAKNLPKRYRSWWNTLEKIHKTHKIDWSEVYNMLEDKSVTRIKKHKINSRRKSAQSLADIVRAQADENEAKKMDEIMKSPTSANTEKDLKDLGDAENPFDDDYNPENNVKEADEEQPTPGVKYPDYDSTYIPP